MDDRTGVLLRQGETCWRLEDAERAAFLIDSADYFSALKSALLSARRSIWILAWTFDPLARLTPDLPHRSRDPERADRLGLLLRRLASLNPALDVRVLTWAMPLSIAASQLFAPQRGKVYFHDSRVHYRLDDSLPKSACQHQKIVVIDDRLVFLSGGDVGADRWDTHAHLDRDPRRRLPTGHRYPSRHEVSIMVEGAVASSFSQLFIDRWKASGGGTLAAPTSSLAADDSIWPEDVVADLWSHRLAIARTAPHWKQADGAHEVLSMHLAAIAGAKRSLYIENQYLTAAVIVEALARRLQEPDGPEIVVVGPDHSPSAFDRLTMDAARQFAISRLRAADRYGHFHAYSARTAKGSTIIVHSKVVVVDDQLVRIGSANLNNRSLGLDTECDVALEATDDPAGGQIRLAIQGFRDRLVGHFIDCSAGEVRAAVREHGGLAAAIEALDDPQRRRLAPVELRKPSLFQRLVLHYALGDPTSPSDAWRPWRRRKRIKAQIRALLPPLDPAPPPAGDGPRPLAPGLRRASRPS